MKNSISASTRRRNHVAITSTLCLLATLSPAAAQTTTTFNFSNDIDLGAQVAGNNDWSWDYFLGVEKSGGVDIGGIIGKQNATIIPEIREPFFGNVIIPEIRGDTRTGIRVNGDVGVRAGLELSADFEAGGLNSGALFDFNPTLTTPDTFAANEFIALSGQTNINTNTSFTDQHVDLPAFSAGMDFVFDLDIDTNIEYGLFPFVGYNKVDFSPDPINVSLPLFEAGINLDPDPEPGISVPGFPTFNLPSFGLDILPGPNVSDTDVVFEKQISIEPKQKKDANGNPIGDPPPSGFNIDIGEVELVRPVRGADLEIETQINSDSVGFTVDANILRLGLDLDGIASAAAFGTSFTNFETGIDGVGSIEFDLIDIKYGPELGYKQDHTITPELEAVLTFSEDVLIDFDGTLVVTDTLTGDWTDLPNIALLGDTPVEVTVDFTEYEAFVKQNGYVTISDYMELKALELTLAQELGIPFLPDSLTLGPVIHERFSILGALLGEIEIPVFEDEKSLGTFSLAGNSLTNQNFTLTPTPSPRLILSNPGQTPDLLSTWKSIDDGTTPSTLNNTTLVIGSMTQDAATSQMIVTPEVYVDPGQSGTPTGISIAAIDILDGSAIIQTGARRYNLDRISNRGSYVSNGYTEFNAGTASLSIRGNGGDIIFNGGSKLVAGLMIHGEDHTLVFRENNPANAVVGTDNIHQFQISQTLNNDGVIIADNSRLDINLNAGAELVSSGPNAAILARNGANVTIDALELKGNGRYEATGLGTSMTFDNIALPNPVAPGNPDRVFSETGDTGPQLLADQNASLTLLGKTNVFGNARFTATQSGTVGFTGILKQVSGNIAEAPKIVLETDATGTIELNGLEMPQFTSEEQANAYEGGFDIINRGLLDIQSGENFLIVDPPNSSGPFGGGGDPFPVAKPVDLVNEGTVRIHAGARFGFDVDITNYVAGGASLDQGTWEVLGETPVGFFLNILPESAVVASQAASLLIFVDKVSNNETYLGTVDFDDDPNYTLDDFDTDLKFNQANVKLSGQAYFPYFNTVEENYGSIQLDNFIEFRTATDFLNRGVLNVTNNAKLNVAGDFTTGPDGVSTIDAAVVADGAIKVLGGTLNYGRADRVIRSLDFDLDIREVWAGFDESGNDVFLSAVMNLAGNQLERIAGGTTTLEGENITFAALDALEQIDSGATLELLGGYELRIGQSLNVEGTLKLDDAAKLYIDNGQNGIAGGELFSSGNLIVGSDSFIEIAGGLTVTAGTIQLDGVINAPLIDIAEGVVVTGSGQLTGSLNNAGRFSPGSSPGAFETFELFAQLSSGTLAMEITSAEEGETHDQLILREGGVLDGVLELIFDDIRPTLGESWVLIDNRKNLFGDFLDVQVTGLDAALDETGVTKTNASDELLGSRGGLNLYLTRFGGDGDDLAVYAAIGAFLAGDFNGNGSVEQGDLNLVLNNWGSDTAGNLPADWVNDLPLGSIDQAELNRVLNNWGSTTAPDFTGFDVPEPATAVVLGALTLATLRRRAA